MPKRTDLKSILIIGAGPIVIGQACEFDYSGAQACKALREEGYRVILVNSNPATIMTDPETADAIYIEPINWRTVARIIERERPDALLPTMGGQTALNTALDLVREGVLKQYDVELIAASREAIDMAEDRERFRNAMREIGLEVPHSQIARSLEEALAVQSSIGYPIVIRPSFTMGGSGGGIAYNREEFETIVQRGLDASPTRELLLEESVLGWKEFEMEVVRDRKDNCIIVCSIENLDPMGVHTGDSITVAPGADADRQGIPAHARCLDRGAAQDRRRVRRLERAVRDRSERRPHAGDRDESARVALLGAGVQGDRLSDRQGRRQARGRLHARRAAQRDHRRRDAGLVRADHRLRRHQDSALHLREISGGQHPPDHADEIGRRGDGHRPHLPGIAAQGAARPGDRARRARSDPDVCR